MVNKIPVINKIEYYPRNWKDTKQLYYADNLITDEILCKSSKLYFNTTLNWIEHVNEIQRKHKVDNNFKLYNKLNFSGFNPLKIGNTKFLTFQL